MRGGRIKYKEKSMRRVLFFKLGKNGTCVVVV